MRDELAEAAPKHPPPGTHQPARPLLARVLVINAVVLVAAAVGLILTPVTVSDPVALQEIVVLVAGLAALVTANLFLLRRTFAPLERLTELMGHVDYSRPGLRIPIYGDDAEIIRLTRAFNEMLDRLEAEQRASIRRATEAQEGERRRVAQELHDQVGQSLTALKLLLARAVQADVSERERTLTEAKEIAEQSIAEVRDIARRLRPEALEELGLSNAIASLADRTAAYGGIQVSRRVDRDLPELAWETEVAIYRIAQESLTNVLRHANASHVALSLGRDDDGIALVVSDDGSGFDGAAVGDGISGMRERALAIGGELETSDLAQGGAQVRVTVPVHMQGPR